MSDKVPNLPRIVHKPTCARLGKPGPTGFKACDCGATKKEPKS